MNEWTPVLDLIGKLAVLIAGIRILAMASEAPQRGCMPLILTKADIEKHSGSLRFRQVLLFFFGISVILYAVSGLAD